MASQLCFNEGKACDAILRRLEAREVRARRNVRFPERDQHLAPVELVCEIGSYQDGIGRGPNLSPDEGAVSRPGAPLAAQYG